MRIGQRNPHAGTDTRHFLGAWEGRWARAGNVQDLVDDHADEEERQRDHGEADDRRPDRDCASAAGQRAGRRQKLEPGLRARPAGGARANNIAGKDEREEEDAEKMK